MEIRTLGRTGLQVSICGLGGGGTSRLGLETGSTPEQAIAVVQRGLELGINYFDSAQAYETEEVMGRALAGHRDEVILSTKARPFQPDGTYIDRSILRNAVEDALQNFRTDVIDVYHIHHLTSENYDHCVSELVPELMDLRDEGKVRFIAASENTNWDPEHNVLQRALQDDCWDVFMTSYNLFNQSARERVYPGTIEKQIGIEIMASARNHFSRPDRLTKELLRLADSGEIDGDQIDRNNPLGFLLDDKGVASVADASYRLVAHEPGVHVVLVGTGNIAHLEENVRSLNAGPLPTDVRDKLMTLFGHLTIGVERTG